MRIKIYYHDTDCGQVVYYANYLKYIEEARTEFFENRGISIRQLAQDGVLFVVGRQEIDYKFPSFYGDVLEVDTEIIAISTVKIEFRHKMRNQNNQIVCLAKTVMVCVGNDLKPKIIPEELKRRLAVVFDFSKKNNA